MTIILSKRAERMDERAKGLIRDLAEVNLDLGLWAEELLVAGYSVTGVKERLREAMDVCERG